MHRPVMYRRDTPDIQTNARVQMRWIRICLVGNWNRSMDQVTYICRYFMSFFFVWKYFNTRFHYHFKHKPASILFKSIAGRYRPVSYPDWPTTACYRFTKNAYWETWIDSKRNDPWEQWPHTHTHTHTHTHKAYSSWRVNCSGQLNGMTLESNDHTHTQSLQQLTCQLFRARQELRGVRSVETTLCATPSSNFRHIGGQCNEHVQMLEVWYGKKLMCPNI